MMLHQNLFSQINVSENILNKIIYFVILYYILIAFYKNSIGKNHDKTKKGCMPCKKFEPFHQRNR